MSMTHAMSRHTRVSPTPRLSLCRSRQSVSRDCRVSCRSTVDPWSGGGSRKIAASIEAVERSCVERGAAAAAGACARGSKTHARGRSSNATHAVRSRSRTLATERSVTRRHPHRRGAHSRLPTVAVSLTKGSFVDCKLCLHS